MSRGGPIVFFGSAEFAVPCMEALVGAGENIALVVAQPDRPKGRGRRLESPPSIKCAERLSLKTAQPEKASSTDFVEKLLTIAPEFLVVAAYGQILKSSTLNAAKYGAVNLHPSFLPRYRGPAPIAWTILSGEIFSCNSVIKLDEGMDSGPVYVQETYELSAESTCGELERFLAQKGAALMVSTLKAIRAGLVPQPQDHAKATFSYLLTKEMRRVAWTDSSDVLRCRIHALSPRPGAVAKYGGRLVKLLRARETPCSGPPGVVIAFAEDMSPIIGCGKGSIAITEVHPEGKRPMGGADFARGCGLSLGDRMEEPWE